MNHFQDRWIEVMTHERIEVIRREADNRRLVKLARGNHPVRRLPEFRLLFAHLRQPVLSLRSLHLPQTQEPSLSPCPEPAVWE